LKAVSERGNGEGFPPSDTIQLSTDWSSDGRWIFYQTSVTQVNSEIWLASAADRKIMPLLKTRFDNVSPALSPNREYLAFCANDTGRHEIYVQRFQEGDPPKLVGDRRRVSRNGGTFPQWRTAISWRWQSSREPKSKLGLPPPSSSCPSFSSRVNEAWPGYEVIGRSGELADVRVSSGRDNLFSADGHSLGSPADRIHGRDDGVHEDLIRWYRG
jgi:hypothetical protein